MLPDQLTKAARDLLTTFESAGRKLTTAESCTGGLVAAALTAISGSSAVLDRGFVTYSNQAKTDMLGVPAELIAAEGAVSEPVARAMAEGALLRSKADVSVSVTGIAGPTGGTPAKPVGLVHFAAVGPGGVLVQREVFAGDRDAVRLQAAITALALAVRAAKQR